MDKEQRKKLMNAYSNRKQVGGVYCIECNGNHKQWAKSSVDIIGIQNRFEFAIATKGCPEPEMRKEWEEYGPESFSMRVLEELVKKESQTETEFASDIDVLYDIWMEKLQNINYGD